MNHTLPPTREVPPRRHAQIRARLEREVTHRRVRFAPLITAGVAAAAVVVVLVAVVAPSWQAGDDFAVGGTSQTVVTTTAEEPVVPTLPPERIAEIEQGCAQSAEVTSKPVLRQYLTDENGEFALLYSERESLACTINGPTEPYSSAVAGSPGVAWLPGEFAADHVSSSVRGLPGHPGPEYDMAAGRVTSKVARVAFGRNGREVDATIVDGTFVARLTHPSDWPGFAGWDERNYLRAYDAHGALLGEWQAGVDRTSCWVNPSGKIVAGYHDRDPATCAPAVAWE
ncbi:hypothetical protein ADK67_43320 [Saccharothrix sp. NRRL B-16348]|uniref:hypothetical protein n=1 Tax=Saccharothrix sp. NRRL B-16348 TaxID=1415542 RepID=UPI0006AE7162|nr:hypothetical protein [Saccharothrix sp. NRRL B-16348]KOX13915.1 hypothetical protein ADK67_43320 [Saccharothrix sp. NRRL B-16348]